MRGQLDVWYARPAGRHLAAQERRLADGQLGGVFGYHLLRLGAAGAPPLGDAARVGHRINAAAAPGAGIGLLAEPDCLPFASDSIDAVLLHHILEFAPDPQALLREACRVIAPQGHIFVIAFNPHSLYGAGLALRRAVNKTAMRPPSLPRLRAWLRKSGMEPASARGAFILPPILPPLISAESALGRRLFNGIARADSFLTRCCCPGGGVVALLAQKQVRTLTPMRQRTRRARDNLIGLTVPMPNPAPAPRHIGDAAA